jgi:hypothetical protein
MAAFGSCLAFMVTLNMPVMTGFGLRVYGQVPGPELFAKEPRTSLELWDAIDYLVRTNQVKKALPYLDKFMKSKPDDATLIAIRNRFGAGSILRLSDDPLTRSFAKPLTEALVAAARKYATRPERIARFIGDLTKTAPEQEYAIRRLKEAGPYAVPFLVQALSRQGLSGQERRQIVHSIGQLDRSALPPLIAVLASPDQALAGDAATALGMIGDKRAIPHLTALAALPDSPPTARTAARDAIVRLTGQSFEQQIRTPAQVLTDAAWRFHRHQVELGDELVIVWTWDKDQNAPVPREVSTTEAEVILGLPLAKAALRLSPGDRSARVVDLSITVEKAIERAGFASLIEKDQAAFNTAKAAGPSLLSEVLKTAIADGKTDLAAVVASALGEVIDGRALLATGRPHPLVDALYAPGRRLQFAAARAIVKLAPSESFPGASRVVPTLARFLPSQSLPRAVVIDANPNRGSQLAGFLINLGYDSELEVTGTRGFVAATTAADVELILISYDLFGAGWALSDTLANLQTDSRTAAIPIFIYGPINVQFKHPNLERDYPGIRYLVQPVDAAMLKRQIRDLPVGLSNTERAGYAREASELLVQIAKARNGPLAVDLSAAEPALSTALREAQTGPAAATALADVPDPDAQRSLAELILDPSRPMPLRKGSTTELIRSIKQFGRLISATQEARFASLVRAEEDAELRADLEAVVRALRPAQTKTGLKQPTTGLTPAQAPSQ